MTSLIPSTQSQLMTYTYKKQDQYIQSADTVCRQINIADIIDNHPDLTMFKHVLAKSNMTDMFKHTYYNKKYTLFVPNNNSLSHDKMNQLTRIDTADAIHIVDISDIIYCKSENNYTYIYLMGENKLVVSRTLKEFDELLGEVSFLRVHQSYLINSNQIDYFDKKEGGAVVMKNGNKIPVSFRKKEQLLQLIQKLGRQL
jgi:DNA-binding LytR/AlgR family response regulator